MILRTISKKDESRRAFSAIGRERSPTNRWSKLSHMTFDRRINSHQQVKQTRLHDLLSSASERIGCQILLHSHLTLFTARKTDEKYKFIAFYSGWGAETSEAAQVLAPSSPMPPVTPKDTDMNHVAPSNITYLVISSRIEIEAGSGIRMECQNGNSDLGWENSGVRNCSTACSKHNVVCAYPTSYTMSDFLAIQLCTLCAM